MLLCVGALPAISTCRRPVLNGRSIAALIQSEKMRKLQWMKRYVLWGNSCADQLPVSRDVGTRDVE